jgi:NAD(P)-dependent dehydrogenase (short-subunit alcohol dehydrogenase family)
VNISSDAGLSGDFGPPAYSASKAAVINLTQHAATLLGRQGVRVNAVAPGLVNTPPSRETIETMGSIFRANTLLPRLAEPGDIANAALFLACDEASFITGQVLSVDGGYLAHQPHYSEVIALMDS